MANTPQPNAEPNHVADVSMQRIAKVYAEALWRAASKRGEADALAAELDALENIAFKISPLLAAFLTSGVVSRDSKAKAIHAAFDDRAGELLTNLLLVLNDHDRLDLLRPIYYAFKELRDERAGRVRVTVRSAAPLATDQIDKLRRELRDTFHKEPVLATDIDPDLLGGLVVQMGDWVFDGSVRTRLENIKNQILTRSSHEIQSGRDRFSVAGGN